MYKSRVCPKCESWEVEEMPSIKPTETEFACKKCGYRFKSEISRQFK